MVLKKIHCWIKMFYFDSVQIMILQYKHKLIRDFAEYNADHKLAMCRTFAIALSISCPSTLSFFNFYSMNIKNPQIMGSENHCKINSNRGSVNVWIVLNVILILRYEVVGHEHLTILKIFGEIKSLFRWQEFRLILVILQLHNWEV